MYMKYELYEAAQMQMQLTNNQRANVQKYKVMMELKCSLIILLNFRYK